MRVVFSNVLRLILLFSVALQNGNTLAAEFRYTNLEYGYALRLPAELPRRTSEAPAPQHGFALDLPSGGKIWVDGSYDAALYGSAAAALTALLPELDGKLPQARHFKLAKLDAARVSYAQGELVSMRVIAYRPRLSAIAIVYTFALDTSPSQLLADRKLFDKLLKNFGVTRLPH